MGPLHFTCNVSSTFCVTTPFIMHGECARIRLEVLQLRGVIVQHAASWGGKSAVILVAFWNRQEVETGGLHRDYRSNGLLFSWNDIFVFHEFESHRSSQMRVGRGCFQPLSSRLGLLDDTAAAWLTRRRSARHRFTGSCAQRSAVARPPFLVRLFLLPTITDNVLGVREGSAWVCGVLPRVHLTISH